jgi:hypothetical protein
MHCDVQVQVASKTLYVALVAIEVGAMHIGGRFHTLPRGAPCYDYNVQRDAKNVNPLQSTNQSTNGSR